MYLYKLIYTNSFIQIHKFHLTRVQTFFTHSILDTFSISASFAYIVLARRNHAVAFMLTAKLFSFPYHTSSKETLEMNNKYV